MLTKQSIDKLTALLALPATGQEQDWEIELADKDRISDFLMAHKRAALSSDDKVALMALLLASVDRHIEATSRPPKEWTEIAEILIQERGLHQETVAYWRRDDDDDPEMWFYLTPHVRALDGFREESAQ